jgi:UPF0176 protein
MSFEVLLYYQFTPIADPNAFRDEHYQLCQKLGLRGRILVAAEGLNGTVAGPPEATAAYIRAVSSMAGFESIEWKRDICETVPFDKLKVKVRKSLVSLGECEVTVPKEKTPQNTGKYLEPAEWKRVLESDEDFVLLDVRNNYEAEVGRFDGAQVPPYENFHDFPKWADELAEHKDKKILMYCTGGIRCEKFSTLLVEKGFSDVNQLHGGILTYGKQFGSEHFSGSCFVFDDRLTVKLAPDAKPIAQCRFCAANEDRMLNCANMECNELFVCCDVCARTHEGTCSAECRAAGWVRPFDEKTFRVPFRKKGQVFPPSRFEIRKKRG